MLSSVKSLQSVTTWHTITSVCCPSSITFIIYKMFINIARKGEEMS